MSDRSLHIAETEKMLRLELRAGGAIMIAIAIAPSKHSNKHRQIVVARDWRRDVIRHK